MLNRQIKIKTNLFLTLKKEIILGTLYLFSSPSSLPLLTLTFSLFTSSVTVRVSITGFFLIITSSLTYGCFEISISSFINGILISVFDRTGPSPVCSPAVASFTGLLLWIVISSYVIGTSTVVISVTDSFVTVRSTIDCTLFISNLSSTIGMRVSFNFKASSPSPGIADITLLSSLFILVCLAEFFSLSDILMRASSLFISVLSCLYLSICHVV